MFWNAAIVNGGELLTHYWGHAVLHHAPEKTDQQITRVSHRVEHILYIFCCWLALWCRMLLGHPSSKATPGEGGGVGYNSVPVVRSKMAFFDIATDVTGFDQPSFL